MHRREGHDQKTIQIQSHLWRSTQKPKEINPSRLQNWFLHGYSASLRLCKLDCVVLMTLSVTFQPQSHLRCSGVQKSISVFLLKDVHYITPFRTLHSSLRGLKYSSLRGLWQNPVAVVDLDRIRAVENLDRIRGCGGKCTTTAQIFRTILIQNHHWIMKWLQVKHNESKKVLAIAQNNE